MARLFLLIAATIFLAAYPAAHATSVDYCKRGAEYPIKVKAVDINPDPVQSGSPAKFSISASTDSEVSSGKVVIDVKYFFIHVHQETFELCKETPCPISNGDFVMTHEQTLPSYTPPGSYTLTMKILGEDGKQLTCFSFGFSIGFGSGIAEI